MWKFLDSQILVLVLGLLGLLLPFVAQEGNFTSALLGILVFGMAVFHLSKFGTLGETTRAFLKKHGNRAPKYVQRFLIYIEKLLTFSRYKTSTLTTKRTILILGIILILAFIVRVPNLSYLEPYTDEYAHLIGAQDINITGSPIHEKDNIVTEPYTRAYFLTILVSMLFSIFRDSLFWARIPGVMMGAITTIPFFLLGRKIHIYIGFISAFLWAISPWAIATSRNVREYAFFPFFFISIFIFFIHFLKYITKRLENNNLRIDLKLVAYTVIFISPIVYAIFIDPLSTFKQIAVLYIVFYLYLVYTILRSERVSKKIKHWVFLLFSASIIGAGITLITQDINHVSKTPEFTVFWYNLVFGNKSTQWFYNSGIYGFYLLFLFGAGYGIFSIIKNISHTANLVFLSFFGYLYFFVFHFERYARPRYGFALLIWLIPLVAIGIYYLYQKLKPYERRVHGFIFSTIFILALIFVFNPINTYKAFTIKKHGYVPITAEHHDRFLPVVEKYRDDISSDDVIICSLCNALIWNNMVDNFNNNLFQYNSREDTRFEKVRTIVGTYGHGWIILDWRRNGHWSKGLPKENFRVGTKEVIFVERISGFYVYRW